MLAWETSLPGADTATAADLQSSAFLCSLRSRGQTDMKKKFFFKCWPESRFPVCGFHLGGCGTEAARQPANRPVRRGSSGRGQLSPSVGAALHAQPFGGCTDAQPGSILQSQHRGLPPRPCGFRRALVGRRLLQISAHRASAPPGACPELRQGRALLPLQRTPATLVLRAQGRRGGCCLQLGGPDTCVAGGSLAFLGAPRGIKHGCCICQKRRALSVCRVLRSPLTTAGHGLRVRFHT